jgi:hypothetical protein
VEAWTRYRRPAGDQNGECVVYHFWIHGADGIKTKQVLAFISNMFFSEAKQAAGTSDFITERNCVEAARLTSIELHFLDRLEIRRVSTSTQHEQWGL